MIWRSEIEAKMQTHGSTAQLTTTVTKHSLDTQASSLVLMPRISTQQLMGTTRPQVSRNWSREVSIAIVLNVSQRQICRNTVPPRIAGSLRILTSAREETTLNMLSLWTKVWKVREISLWASPRRLWRRLRYHLKLSRMIWMDPLTVDLKMLKCAQATWWETLVILKSLRCCPTASRKCFRMRNANTKWNYQWLVTQVTRRAQELTMSTLRASDRQQFRQSPTWVKWENESTPLNHKSDYFEFESRGCPLMQTKLMQ